MTSVDPAASLPQQPCGAVLYCCAVLPLFFSACC